MKITLENTTKIVELNGVPARIWEGETHSGIKVHAFITRIAVSNKDDTSQFEKELLATKPPSMDIQSYPNRLVL